MVQISDIPEPTERELQIHFDNLRSLQQSRMNDIMQALDSCIRLSALNRKAFADILKLGNQIDIEYYKKLTNTIEYNDRLIDYLSVLIKTEDSRNIGDIAND